MKNDTLIFGGVAPLKGNTLRGFFGGILSEDKQAVVL